MKTTHSIGIDIGRVLMCAADPNGKADTSFLSGSREAALSTPPTDLALEALTALVERTLGKVWLISKAGPRIEELTRAWLVHWDVFRTTGLLQDHVIFCRKREDKAVIAKDLDLHAMVDDRLDVLVPMPFVSKRILFGYQKPGTVVPMDILFAEDWLSATEVLGVSLLRETPRTPEERAP